MVAIPLLYVYSVLRMQLLLVDRSIVNTLLYKYSLPCHVISVLELVMHKTVAAYYTSFQWPRESSVAKSLLNFFCIIVAFAHMAVTHRTLQFFRLIINWRLVCL